MNYESFEHELEERKLVQARARVAFEKGNMLDKLASYNTVYLIYQEIP